MKLCKLLFLGLLAMASATLSGCGAGTLVKLAMTPEVSVCDGLEGKTVAEAEQTLGSPSEIKRQGPEQTRTYKRGFFEGTVKVVDGKITAVECRKN